MMYRGLSCAVSCFLLVWLSGCGKQPEKPKGRPPALVVAAAASQRDVPVQVKAIGTVEASEHVSVRPQISGELITVAFREGHDVQKGALLFRIDPRPYQAALKKAEASLARNRVIVDNARKDYERYSHLVKDGIVTQEQAEGYRTKAESAAADVAADQAAVDNARVQLSYCTITAPLSGRLGALAVDRGNVVKANETVLVTINRLTPVSVSFAIPEKELPDLKRAMSGGRLSVAADVSGGATREAGTLSFLDNAVDPATGTIRLKGEFANSRRTLWPGQFVNVSLTIDIRKNAVVVPSQALQTGQKGPFVFVVRPDSTAELRPVTAGPASQGYIVVEKGLAPGEKVVVDGQMRVVPEGKVDVKAQGQGDGGQGAGAHVK